MDTRATESIRRWSTQDVAPPLRLDYWVGAICEGFLEMDATSPASSCFDATLESAPLDCIAVNRVRGSAQDVYRTPRGIARSRANYFYLLCKQDSAWHTVQDGRSARLMPGDLVLVDSRRCYEFHFPRAADTVSLELPTAWVETWLPRPEGQVARRIDGQAGWGAALSAFVRQMTPEVAVAPPLPGRLLTDHLGSLLALATGKAAPSPPAGASALRQRVLDAIRARHAEPGLTAAAVARGLNLSERSLHRALAGGGLTFAEALLDWRLQAARRMLADRRFDRLTVAEIGRRAGWADASHFIRQCRRGLGATPGALRRGG